MRDRRRAFLFLIRLRLTRPLVVDLQGLGRVPAYENGGGIVAAEPQFPVQLY